MRDILNDPDHGRSADPVRKAQEQMRRPLARRFYKSAGVKAGEKGHEVQLDGRTARTPGANKVALPTRAAAALVAGEYEAQAEVIDPVTMPVTRLVNTAIDGVAADPQAVLEDMLRYSASDLVCYRADAPAQLVDRQSQCWDPVIDWALERLGARFILSEGVMHVVQPRESIAALGTHLRGRLDPFQLASLHVMTSLTGSALIAAAVEDGAVSAEAAWDAAHVDEDWNISQWGEDAEAKARRAARKLEFLSAVALVRAIARED